MTIDIAQPLSEMPTNEAPVVVFPPVPTREKLAPPSGPIGLLELLLREPDRFLDALDHIDDDDGDARISPSALLRVLVGAVAVGAGLFGAIVGAHRGGLQVLSCALKVPLILLVTLVVCTPPFLALSRAAQLPLGSRRVVALALGSCARFALVLVGLAPFVWLMEGWTLGYHRVILAVVAVCALAGFSAGRLLFTGLSRAGGAGTRVGLAFVAVFGLVGAQTSWILRPFVVRPRSEHVPFVRALEGDFLDAVATSARSAAGVYDRRVDPRRGTHVRDTRCEAGSCD